MNKDLTSLFCKDGSNSNDVYFEKIDNNLEFYYKKDNFDVPIGLYWHSFATSYEMGFDEAKSIYQYSKMKKDKCPIYIDIELLSFSIKEAKMIMKDVIRGFCTYFEMKGLCVDVSSNSCWFKICVIFDNNLQEDKSLIKWEHVKALYCDYDNLNYHIEEDERENNINRKELFI